MRGRRRDVRPRDAGFTLIELLISVTLSVALMAAMVASFMLVLRTAIGLSRDSSVATSGAQNDQLVAAQVDASESVQQLSRSFSADVENAAGYDRVTATNPTMPCTTASPAPSKGATTGMLLAVQQYDRTGATHLVGYAFRTDALRQLGIVTRYECVGVDLAAAGSASAVVTVLAENLSTKSGDAPTVARTARAVSMTLVAMTGRKYVLDATVRLDVAQSTPVVGSAAGSVGGASPTPSPATSLDPLKAAITSVLMFDDDTNGRVDRFEVNFDAVADSACLASGAWTFTAPPSNGSVTAVAAPGNKRKIILTFTTGANSARQTAVGGARLNFASPDGCNLADLSDGEPQDRASPVLVSYEEPSEGASDGVMAANDSLLLRFSEPLASGIPTSTTVTVFENKQNKPDTILLSGLSDGELGMGSDQYYVTTGGKSATSASLTGVVSRPKSDEVLVTLNNACSGGCDFLKSGSGPFSFLPVATLLDAAGNGATPDSSTPAPSVSPWKIL